MAWDQRLIDGQILAVHAALLKTGEIIYSEVPKTIRVITRFAR